MFSLEDHDSRSDRLDNYKLDGWLPAMRENFKPSIHFKVDQ